MSRLRIGSGRDEGITLLEILVALGIFGVLMGLVSGVLVSGLRSMMSASTANQVQAQEENALEWMSRLIRYIDNPVETATPTAAILQATPSSLTFFTFAGTGTVDRQPYKVLLCTSTRGVESFIWEPALVNGVPVANASPNLTVPTCNDAGAAGAQRRVLEAKTREHTPSLGFRYWRAHTAADGAGDADVELVPSGSLTAAQLASLTKIQVTLGDSLVTVPLDQTVLLVNTR